MANKLFSYLLCTVLLLTSITPAFALNLCETKQGFSALFFNGVWNTTDDANSAFEDIAEVFIQRANELDVDPTKHFDSFTLGKQ